METSKKYLAAAYMRLSVADDRIMQSESISNQEYIIRRFVENHPNIEIVSERIDDGHSGLVFNRPSFTAMIQDAIEGKINCIIVKDLSRFGREYCETGRFLRKLLPAYGVRFVSVTDGNDTDQTPADDNLLMHIKTAINDEFSRELSVKTRAALLSMRKSGLYVGACPIYGYQKSEESRNHLIVDKRAASVVRDIFKMKIEGYSTAAIAANLNEKTILSPSQYKKSMGRSCPRNGFADRDDAEWSVTTILRILKDETYTGVLVQGKQYTPNYKITKQFTRPESEWIYSQHAHEAIISAFDFETVQRIMILDTRSSPGMDTVNLFSGLLTCGCCNKPMTRKTVIRSGKNHHYYYCRTGKRNGCHSPAFIQEDLLTAHIFKKLSVYLSKLDCLVRRLNQMSKEDVNRELTQGLAAKVEKLQNNLGETLFFRNKLETALMNGIINEEDRSWMKVDYTKKIVSLESEIDILIHEAQKTISRKDEQIQWLYEMSKLAVMTTFDRATLVRLVENICVSSKNSIEIEFVYEVNECYGGMGS